MKTLIIGLCIFLTIFFTSGERALFSKNIKLFVNMGYNSSIKIDDKQYEWMWETEYIDVIEKGMIDPSSKAGGGIALGMIYPLSNTFSISFSVSYFRSSIAPHSNYSIQWTWYDGESHQREKEWKSSTTPGLNRIFLIPFTLSINYANQISKNSSLILKCGVSYAISKIQPNSRMGYAETLETEDMYYIDWYALKIKIDESDNMFGFQVGIEWEKRLNLKLDFYVGAEYFIFPQRTYMWELVEQNIYYGVEDQLYTSKDIDIHDSAVIESTITFSFFRIFLGLKIHI